MIWLEGIGLELELLTISANFRANSQHVLGRRVLALRN